MAVSETAPELINALDAVFTPAEWTGKYTGGIKPLNGIVIVLCDECSPKTRGGIELPPDIIRNNTYASEQGVIVCLSRSAFLIREDGTAFDRDERPKPGDRIYFEKYAGRVARGADGKVYRLMSYQSIAAIYEEAPIVKVGHSWEDSRNHDACKWCGTTIIDVEDNLKPRRCDRRPAGEIREAA